VTKRTEQISSVIRDAVQRVISRGLQDPRVRGIITVTDVRVTPDLQDAFLMVSVLPEEHQDLTIHGLKAAAGHIRKQIGEDVTARKLPRLNFRLDERMKKEAAVLGALVRVAVERENRPTPLVEVGGEDSAPGGAVAPVQSNEKNVGGEVEGTSKQQESDR
jgi:ribosome-binding factor A